MKRVSLKFKDILQLIDFMEFTNNHHCSADMEEMVLTCELSEPDIELAINGYDAALIAD